MDAKTNKAFFLEGGFAPVTDELDVAALKIVKGAIPKDLNGVLYRNGPNPQFPSEQAHWFSGDGMLHAIHIENGKVDYKNRWIHTERFLAERKAGRALFGKLGNPNDRDPSVVDVSGNTANTNIIQHAGKLLALQETNSPIEIDAKNLHTKGEWGYEGRVPQMSAHPHFDYATGNMHAYAYDFGTTEIIYYIIDQFGKITKIETFNAPYSC